MLDETGADGRLRHTVPAHWVLRVFLVACGAFVTLVLFRELGRALWPLNVFTPFFGVIFFGGLSVGIAMIAAGLFAPTLFWTVSPGLIEIRAVNPFRAMTHRFSRADIASLAVVEQVDSDGPNTFIVRLTTAAGKRFDTRNFGSREAAERLLQRFEAALGG